MRNQGPSVQRLRAGELAREEQGLRAARNRTASGFVPGRPRPGVADPPARVSAESLTVFVATELVNPMNRPTVSYGARMGEAKRAKRQREAVALAVWCALRHPRGPGLAWTVTNPAAPKAITLTAHVGRRFDSDGLEASLKSVRDGLQDAGLIMTDGPAAGHAFEYDQVVDGRRGVTITIRVRA